MKVLKLEYSNYVMSSNFTGKVEFDNGENRWLVCGLLDRLDGPAVEYANGSKAWYKDGKWHRLDGPAIEWADGTKEWWVDDVEVSEEDYPAAVLIYKCKKVLE
jgi:hypothetical protein